MFIFCYSALEISCYKLSRREMFNHDVLLLLFFNELHSPQLQFYNCPLIESCSGSDLMLGPVDLYKLHCANHFRSMSPCLCINVGIIHRSKAVKTVVVAWCSLTYFKIFDFPMQVLMTYDCQNCPITSQNIYNFMFPCFDLIVKSRCEKELVQY